MGGKAELFWGYPGDDAASVQGGRSGGWRWEDVAAPPLPTAASRAAAP